MNAYNYYDYKNQRWVSGAAGVKVRREQLEEEYALLAGPRGADYLRYLGLTQTVDEATSRIGHELSQLPEVRS